MTVKKTPKKSVWEELGYPENHGKPWTVNDMWKLVTLYYQEKPRLTWRTIAQRLKRTVPACEYRMWVIRLAFTLFKTEDAEKIMQMLGKHSGETMYHKHDEETEETKRMTLDMRC